MAERAKPWGKRRRQLDAAARARAARKRKSDGSEKEPGPHVTVNPVPTSQSADNKPRPFTDIGHPEAGSWRAADLEDEDLGASENESENEREESSEGVFGDKEAQETFDDFIVSLPSLQRKTLAVLLMHSFRTRQKMSITDAAREAGSISGYNERTVRKYSKQFFENRGKFPESRQGKYDRRRLYHPTDI